MTRRHFPLWIVLGVAVVAALIVGSGQLTSSPPTPAQRAASIESVVRCPTCEDLSVAQSTAPTAVAVRAAVGQLIAEGRTDQQIKDYLVDRYGSSIVLDPPASGWSLLVWLLPLLAGLVATSALVVVLVRRRRLPGGGDRGPASDLTAEQAGEHRLFLIRSLADADAEYLAGDLSDQDYLALRQRDMVRLAALDAGAAPRAVAPPSGPGPPAGDGASTVSGPAAGRTAVAVEERGAGGQRRQPDDGGIGPGRTSRRRIRRSAWYLAVGCLCLAAALVVAVTTFASNRQPGQSITGTFAQSPGPADRGGPGPGGHRREPGPGGPGRPALPVGAR